MNKQFQCKCEDSNLSGDLNKNLNEDGSFKVVCAGKLNEETPGMQWQIEDIWGRCSVGIIGGEPKCCKSWLALEMALATASGNPCIGSFRVHRKGLCLAYFAEDSARNMARRFHGLCRARGIDDPDSLPLMMIDTPTLKLDEESDRQRLEATVIRYKPVMMILDPLVRLHSLDENSAREMASLLSFLRSMQRNHQMAIVLTHHSGKKHRARPGQKLRGSSDLHAFGDTNLYLTRSGNNVIKMQIEHRDAPSDTEVISMELCSSGNGENTHLKRLNPESRGQDASSAEKPGSRGDLLPGILACLASDSPLTGEMIQKKVGTRRATVFACLKQLEIQGKISKTPKGWRLS